MFERTPESLVRERISVRKYRPEPLSAESQIHFLSILKELETGPFGSRLRFAFVAAREGDFAEMRGLGTYGAIEKPQAYLLAAVKDSAAARYDYGWALQRAVLKAQDLGWGSCWLGGNFTKGSFSARMGVQPGEILPAVLSFGYPVRPFSETPQRKRKDFSELFFEADGRTPLTPESAGAYALPLEMVRLAPSAVNRQPWRVIREGSTFRFHLVRDPYLTRGLARFFVKDRDLQSVDMGIALCHFDLGVRQSGLSGRWSLSSANGCFVWTAG